MLTLNNSDEVFEWIKVEGSITQPQGWFQQMPLIALSSDGHMTFSVSHHLVDGQCVDGQCVDGQFVDGQFVLSLHHLLLPLFPACGALPLAFVCLVVLHCGIISQGFNGEDVYGQRPFINVY